MSKRNNEERTGPAFTDSDPPSIQAPQVASNSNPNVFSFVTPTEFVDLPSKGKFYPEGHPLHNVAEVEIKHMTAKEEDILADQVLLKKGLAFDRLLQSIVVDKSIKIEDLLIGDKNAIMIAARSTGYGPDYDTKMICPVCLEHGRHTFNLDEAKVKHLEGLQDYEATLTEKNTILFKTPKLGVLVECQFLNGLDEKKLTANANRRKKLNLPGSGLIDQLKAIIVSVNNNSDRRYVESFIEKVPARDSMFIRKAYKHCTPDIEIKEDYACGACGAVTELSLPFTTDFFWPDK